MGSSVSKTWGNVDQGICTPKSSSAPIATPDVRRINVDPRSPTQGIARTPIETLKTPLSRAEDCLSEETECQQVILDDPRSPTLDFDRTPIVIEEPVKSTEFRNKNLDKALRSDFSGTPTKPRRKSINQVTKKLDDINCDDDEEEMPKNCSPTPKLLESRIIVGVKTPSNKRNSVVGLLETNLDYIETDLDAVIQNNNKAPSKLEEDTDVEEAFEPDEHKYVVVVNEENLDHVEETLPKNTDNDFMILQEDDQLKLGNTNVELPEVVTEEAIPQEETIEEEILEAKEEIEVPPNTADELNTRCDRFQKVATPSPVKVVSVKKITSDILDQDVKRESIVVEELNRKLTNLIYEDQQAEKIITPKANRLLINNGNRNRTPLGDRKNTPLGGRNVQRKKLAPKLIVRDKPIKTTNNTSKIPVFKDKGNRKVDKIQCENTPPTMMMKRSQWSNEDSLVI